MSSAAMADDLEQLRQYLELETIDLLGHSNGGAIALAYAQGHGAHLHKLVLVDSQLIGFGGGEATREFLRDAADDPRYRAAVPCFARPVPEADDEFAEFLGQLLPLYLHDPGKYLPLFEGTMEGPISAWAWHRQNAADGLPGVDQTSRLGEIRARTLILVGKHDWICPVIVSERLHSGIQGSKLVLFEHTGHLPWIEEPERFFAEITRFLAE
jgi:pimeloyl-ACP methyl ester carboxylesterase